MFHFVKNYRKKKKKTSKDTAAVPFESYCAHLIPFAISDSFQVEFNLYHRWTVVLTIWSYRSEI